MATLETIKARNDLAPRASNCGAHSLLLHLNNQYYVFSLRCKSWGCPHCAKLNADMWAARVSLQPCERFLTLTDLGETRASVSARVTELFRRIRKLGIKFEYWGMVELHKSGLPHWHSICHGDFIPPLVLKWLCRESGIGHTDIRKITSGRGAAYYCVKHLGHAHQRRWTGRQVRYSRGFFINKESWDGGISNSDQGEWEMVFGRARFVAEKMNELGYKTELVNDDLDFIVGDVVRDGEIIKSASRTSEMGFGEFEWKSMGVRYGEI